MGRERCVAVIPARAGSKGIPRKCLADVCGVPLIVHTVRAALGTASISRTLVTTEDPEIAEAAAQAGAEIIARPAHLATDDAKGLDVVLHAAEWLLSDGDIAEWLVWMQPTSPLRTAAHTEEFLQRVFSEGPGSSVSVTELEHTPYKSLVLRNGHLEPLLDRSMLSANRQSLPTAFRANGALWAARLRDIISHGTLWIDPILPYRMSTSDSIDVDTLADLDRVRAALAGKRR